MWNVIGRKEITLKPLHVKKENYLSFKNDH